nr:MAG TPA: hypothetical protein [Caudoviricetes sp.]
MIGRLTMVCRLLTIVLCGGVGRTLHRTLTGVLVIVSGLVK